MKRSIATLLWVAALLLGSPALGAESLNTGDPFPPFTAQDQHGVPFNFEPGIQTVLIAFEMGSSKAANRVLAELPEDYLDEHSAVYVSNIHGMPGIGRRFALPKMRKYPHRIVLADEENLLAPFPHRKGLVTVLELDDAGMIQSVGYWNPGEEPLILR